MRQILKDLVVAVICSVVTLGGFVSVFVGIAYVYGWRPLCGG